LWSQEHCYDERGAHIHGHTAGDDEAERSPHEWRPGAGVLVTRPRGWHRDPFGIHHERFYYAEDRPGRLVRDERRRESFDDPPSGFLPSPPEPSFPDAQPGTDRVEVAAAQAVPDPGFVAPVTPAATRPTHVPWTGTSRHAPMPDGWVDAPTHGWSNWVHEFTLSGLLQSFKSFKRFKPSRRILVSVGAAALVILLIVVGLLVGTSPNPHQSATSTSTLSGQTAGTLPAAAPTTTPPNVAGAPVDQSRPGWQTTQSFGTLSQGLTGVSCATGTTCEAVGVTGYGTALALGTTNGGTAWTQQGLPKVDGSLTAVACPSSAACIAVGSGAYLTTADGGLNWTPHSFGHVSFTGISCAGPKFCLAVGSTATHNTSCPAGSSYASSDGGKTWSTTTLGCVVPANVSCSSATTCEVVGQAFSDSRQYGQIMGTSDSGSSWQVQYKLMGGTTSLNGITCTSSKNCLVVGGSLKVPILTTADGGATWTAPPAPSTEGALGAVACDSSQTCQAVGSGLSLSTADGGSTWGTQATPGGIAQVTSVACPSATLCVGVGDTPSGAGVTLKLTS
jgi:photosystem II stability/assembly factor-like uncharacterized protein